MKITAELLARHDRPGPRYTSYPTAVEFNDSVGPDTYAEHLARAASRPDEPLSLYVHLPFCDARCSFCGCHVVVASRPEVASGYLARLMDEADVLAHHLDGRRRLAQLHLGGGTPTQYSPGDLTRLWEHLSGLFTLEDGAEVAVELDPRVTTPEHLRALAAMGVNRYSLGVQDTDPEVQELIGRHQTWEQTRETFWGVRDLGPSSVNIDLIYGLPGQTEASFERTLGQIIELRPDRLAAYSFAYVPWIRQHQRRIDKDRLPPPEVKFALLARAIDELVAAGYRRIGMDHFALPEDDLARARSEGTLARNFMGYTVMRVDDVVGLGSSAIGDVQGAYVQAHRRLASYLSDAAAGRLPVERGVVLDDDDLVRRAVIGALMCTDTCRTAEIEQAYGIDFATYFAPELTAFATPGGLIDEGFVTVDDTAVTATELGSLFIRNVAMVFDRYRRAPSPTPTFSRTV